MRPALGSLAFALLPWLAACGGGGGGAPAAAVPEISAVTADLPVAGGAPFDVVGHDFPGRPGDPVTVRFVAASALPPCAASSWTVAGTRASDVLVQGSSPATSLLVTVAARVEVTFADGTTVASASAIGSLLGEPDPERDQDEDGVPDGCDEDTYDFRSIPAGERPPGVERLGAAASALAGAPRGGVSYGGAGFNGVQDRVARLRADFRGQDETIYVDVDPGVPEWCNVEIWSEGSFGDYAGYGVIVQVGADGLLRLYERQWNGILHAVTGPALPSSGRLRFRMKKGAGLLSTLRVDGWNGHGWDADLATYDLPDDTMRRGLDVSLANYMADRRAIRRISAVRQAPPGDLVLASDPAHSSDAQVFQRGPGGTATIPLAFFHRLPSGGRAQARVVRAGDGLALPGHDFADHEVALAAAPLAGARASLPVAGVPTGGNYDVHLRLLGPDGAVVATAARRDVAVGDVWLAAGQSNMSGYSGNFLGSEDPTPLAHLYGNDGLWKPAREPMDDGTNQTDPISYEQPVHSCMLSFANALAAATGVPVGVVPASLGGTALYSQWQRDPGQPDIRITLYGSLLHRARAASGTFPPAGILWFQGESDAIAGRTVAQYRADLEALAANLRGDLSAPALPFLCGQLGTWDAATLPAWLAVQEAQRQAAEADPRMELVTAVDLPRADGIHFNVAGYRELGRRFASAARALLFGGPPPTARAAAVAAGPGGTSIRITYDAAVAGGAASLYSVADAAGAPAVLSASAAGGIVTLDLDRSLVPPAFVTYGLSTSPSAPWVEDLGGVAVPCFLDLPVGP